MDETNIVKCIDEFGRVAIPKELRRKLKLKEGDSLEICYKEGGLFLRKCPTEEEIEEEKIANECAKIVNKAISDNVLWNTFVVDEYVTVLTPKGTATAECSPQSRFDVNIGAVVALSKLGFCKKPDGLGN